MLRRTIDEACDLARRAALGPPDECVHVVAGQLMSALELLLEDLLASGSVRVVDLNPEVEQALPDHGLIDHLERVGRRHDNKTWCLHCSPGAFDERGANAPSRAFDRTFPLGRGDRIDVIQEEQAGQLVTRLFEQPPQLLGTSPGLPSERSAPVITNWLSLNSPAVARARYDLPLPGGPTRMRSLAATCGFARTSPRAFRRRSLTSSRPPTSANVSRSGCRAAD